MRVLQEAALVFGDVEIAREWMHTSIPALSGELPINLCDTFEGRKIVKESLKAIKYMVRKIVMLLKKVISNHTLILSKKLN